MKFSIKKVVLCIAGLAAVCVAGIGIALSVCEKEYDDMI